ncbi:MAG: hypoxanthine phosphoribosyltransferase [Longimicrobiales bacterium]|nr:hypoxanthine phosphoribosyltransferase [Longimicrobiales bacterium]
MNPSSNARTRPVTPDLSDPRLGAHSLVHVVYSADEVRERVQALGRAIARELKPDEDLLVVGLLKGSFIFMADLVRAIPRPMKVDFIRVASYGSGSVTSGEVKLLYDPETSLEGRSVVIVEDIIDSGTTLQWLLPQLERRGPRRLEVCALLHKRIVALDPHPRWVGFDAPRDFLVGYGLDYGEQFRHLPYIGALEPGRQTPAGGAQEEE